MKKVLFMLPMLAALFLSGCSKDDEPSVSTFTIINNLEKYESSLDEYMN